MHKPDCCFYQREWFLKVWTLNDAGLPLSTNESRLWKAFSEFGEVTQVEIGTDRKTMQSLGFAFVWFSKKESTQLAVEEMNGKFFDGRFLKVTVAKPDSPKQRPRVTPYKF